VSLKGKPKSASYPLGITYSPKGLRLETCGWTHTVVGARHVTEDDKG
jgi:hypothetical protein